MKISVLGLGRIGLPTAVVFASKGFSVTGVDIDEKKVKMINEGKHYIHEPGLEELLKKTVSKGFLVATNDISVLRHNEVAIVSVSTPVKSHVVDFSYLKSALESIRNNLHENQLVAIESTIPPGTTLEFALPLLEERGLEVEKDFYLAHIPERIAPGRAVNELLNAPRIVGGVGPNSTRKAIEAYSKVNPTLLPTDATTAEFVKLIENTFRDLNIAYANLLAVTCEKIGVDVYEAIELASTHPRVNILSPGCGVGGPCLTKDPYMLAKIGEKFFGAELITIARKINEFMPKHVAETVMEILDSEGVNLANAKVTILGVAYKGGVDDVRESPAKTIVSTLVKNIREVDVFDPYAAESFGAKKVKSLEEAVKDTDAIIVVTDHPDFKNINLKKLRGLVNTPIIFDGRRVIEPHDAVKHGFRYYNVGSNEIKRIQERALKTISL